MSFVEFYENNKYTIWGGGGIIVIGLAYWYFTKSGTPPPTHPNSGDSPQNRQQLYPAEQHPQHQPRSQPQHPPRQSQSPPQQQNQSSYNNLQPPSQNTPSQPNSQEPLQPNYVSNRRELLNEEKSRPEVSNSSGYQKTNINYTVKDDPVLDLENELDF